MQKGAGILVLRKFDEGYCLLCLRYFDAYDLPKGHLDKDEELIDAAMRETKEESGIEELNFKWGYSTIALSNKSNTKRVTLFVAVTEQAAKIQKNPNSGRFEHHEASWLTLDEAEKQLYSYLRPAATWCKNLLIQYKEEFAGS